MEMSSSESTWTSKFDKCWFNLEILSAITLRDTLELSVAGDPCLPSHTASLFPETGTCAWLSASFLVSDQINPSGIFLLENIHLGIPRNTVAKLWDVHTWIRKIYLLQLGGLRSFIQLYITDIPDLIFWRFLLASCAEEIKSLF